MTSSPMFTPALRSDLLRRELDHDSLIWSPIRPTPAVLDPVATVLLGVIDGMATVADLAQDVEDVVGIERSVAEAQVRRVVTQLDEAGALTTSPPSTHAERQQELFVNPPST